MRTLSIAMVRSYWKDRAQPEARETFGEQLKGAWAVLVLLACGFFALVTAVLVAWPALAFLAARVFG